MKCENPYKVGDKVTLVGDDGYAYLCTTVVKVGPGYKVLLNCGTTWDARRSIPWELRDERFYNGKRLRHMEPDDSTMVRRRKAIDRLTAALRGAESVRVCDMLDLRVELIDDTAASLEWLVAVVETEKEVKS